MTIEQPPTQKSDSSKGKDHVTTTAEAQSRYEIDERIPGLRKFLRTKFGMVAVIASAGTFLASVVFGVNNIEEQGSDIAPPVAASPFKVVPPTEIPSTTSPETPLTVESLQLDAALLSNPEALAETFVNGRVTAWFNAGATPENAQAAFDSPSIDEYAANLAAETDKIFIEALLVDDWESDPALDEWVANMAEIHKTTLTYYFLTSFPDINPQDEVPYMRESKQTYVNSLTINPDGTVDLVTTDENFDNAGRNRVGEELSNYTKVEANEGTPVRTFAVQADGTLKLASMILSR